MKLFLLYLPVRFEEWLWHIDTPCLSSLSLDNDHVTDHGLVSVVNCLPLTYLSIAFCSSITGNHLICILWIDSSFVNVDQSILKEVHMMWCGQLTDYTFQKLQKCKSLTRIGVSGCEVSIPTRQSCEEKGVILVF